MEKTNDIFWKVTLDANEEMCLLYVSKDGKNWNDKYLTDSVCALIAEKTEDYALCTNEKDEICVFYKDDYDEYGIGASLTENNDLEEFAGQLEKSFPNWKRANSEKSTETEQYGKKEVWVVMHVYNDRDEEGASCCGVFTSYEKAKSKAKLLAENEIKDCPYEEDSLTYEEFEDGYYVEDGCYYDDFRVERAFMED